MGTCSSVSMIEATCSSNDYDVKPKDILGSGMNGYVTQAIHRASGKVCAAKVLPLNSPSARAEVQANRVLQHPHIAQLLDVYAAEDGGEEMTMIMELCSGGELFDRVEKKGRFSDAKAARIIRQVLHAIAYIHGQGFVHTDIKLENVLLVSDADDADIKIIDFGVCQRCSPGKMLSRRVGSIGYTAPEVIKRRYTSKCDLFSVGVIAYILLSDQAPFHMVDEMKSEAKTLAGDYKCLPDGVSSLAKDFVTKLLTVNPSQRMSAVQALEHPWLKEGQGHSDNRTSGPCTNSRRADEAIGKDLDRTTSDVSTETPSVGGNSAFSY